MNRPQNRPSEEKKAHETHPDARWLAYRSLLRSRKEEIFINQELDRTIRAYALDGVDRSFYTALTYGVTEREITLDYILSFCCSRPLSEIDPEVLTVLRLGAYQILYLTRVPDSAACNTSVELVKQFSRRSAPFVNASLRSLVRKKDHLPSPDEKQNPVLALSVRFAQPQWICQLWLNHFGWDKTLTILQGMDTPPTATLRVHTLRSSRETLLQTLQEQHIAAQPTAVSPDGIRLKDPLAIGNQDFIRAGLCFVQDEASQCCVRALDPQPGETVFDVCAAPGGKSFSIALMMENRGIVRSFDLHEKKVQQIRSGAEHLGLSIIHAESADAMIFRSEFESVADRVLCDVPCSGLGVIAKKPDLRKKTPESIAHLPETQYRILCNASHYLKPGGTLVYSTCTLNPVENEQVVQRFLASHPHFYQAEAPRTWLPDGNLPPQQRTDGFFYAKLLQKIH